VDAYHLAKFYTDRIRGFVSAHMRDFAHTFVSAFFGFFGFFQSPTAKTPAPTLTQKTSKDAVPRKDVPFDGSRTDSLTCRPHFPRKPPFLDPFRRNLNFFGDNRPRFMLYMAMRSTDADNDDDDVDGNCDISVPGLVP